MFATATRERSVQELRAHRIPSWRGRVTAGRLGPVLRALHGVCAFCSRPSAPAARPAPVGLKPAKCPCPASGEGLPGGQLRFPWSWEEWPPSLSFSVHPARSVDSFPEV